MKYLIGALVILALLFLGWWFVSRGKQRQLEQQRAEAATMRAGVEERTAALRGQERFAQQADERAMVARQEAEERARQAEEAAREAQRVEDEARRHQADLERGRLQRDAELRRADEIDPDVEVADDDPRPLPEDLDDDVRPLEDTRVHQPVSAGASGATGDVSERAGDTDGRDPAASRWGSPTDEKRPSLFTEEPADDRAQASEHASDQPPEQGNEPGRPESSQERGWGTGAAVAGAGAAAAGSAYAGTRGNEPAEDDDDAARLASGVDYGDPVHDAGSSRERTAMGATDGSTADEGRDDEGRKGELMDDEGRQDERMDGDGMNDGGVNDEAGTDEARRDESGAGEGDMSMVEDVEDYASTEPLRADEQSPGVAVGQSDASDGERRYEGSQDDLGDEDVTAARADDAAPSDSDVSEPTTEETWEKPADVDNPQVGDSGQSAADDSATDSATDSTDGDRTADDQRDSGSDESSWSDGATGAVAGAAAGGAAGAAAGAATRSDGDSETSDPTDGRSGADMDAGTSNDGGDTSDGADTSDGGDGSEGGDATHWPDGTDRINKVDDESASDEPTSESTDESTGDGSDSVAGDQSDSGSGEGGWSRRISGVEEIQDGGYGVGSAAPFEDRAQPRDHPVQAYRDTMTYRAPGANGYDSAEPDVWFYDEESARRAGFNPSEG